MIRTTVLLAAAGLSGCVESPQPVPHTDGEIVSRAVQHAQAQVDKAAAAESGK